MSVLSGRWVRVEPDQSGFVLSMIGCDDEERVLPFTHRFQPLHQLADFVILLGHRLAIKFLSPSVIFKAIDTGLLELLQSWPTPDLPLPLQILGAASGRQVKACEGG